MEHMPILDIINLALLVLILIVGIGLLQSNRELSRRLHISNEELEADRQNNIRRETERLQERAKQKSRSGDVP